MPPFDPLHIAIAGLAALMILFGGIASYWHARLRKACFLLYQARPILATWTKENVPTGRALVNRVDQFLAEEHFP